MIWTDQRTRAGPAIKFLKSFGLKLAIDNEQFITRFGMDKVNLAVPDQVKQDHFKSLPKWNNDFLLKGRLHMLFQFFLTCAFSILIGIFPFKIFTLV